MTLRCFPKENHHSNRHCKQSRKGIWVTVNKKNKGKVKSADSQEDFKRLAQSQWQRQPQTTQHWDSKTGLWQQRSDSWQLLCVRLKGKIRKCANNHGINKQTKREINALWLISCLVLPILHFTNQPVWICVEADLKNECSLMLTIPLAQQKWSWYLLGQMKGRAPKGM